VFRVAAVNGAGTGPYSTASSAVVPFTVPSAPTSVSGSPGNAQIPISWTAPSSNGGSAITDYVVQFSSNGGTSWTTFADGTSTSLSANVTGLTNGTSYVFRVAAVNAAGTGTYSTASSVVVPSAGGGSTGSFILAATTNSGDINSGSSTSMAAARAGDSISFELASAGNTTGRIYQETYYDDESGNYNYINGAVLLEFDTSAIGGTISSATLQLYVDYQSAVVGFTLEAYAFDYGTSITNADWINPTTRNASNILASKASSTITSSTTQTLTSNGTNLITAINQSGKTRILLISSRARLASNPTEGTTEFIDITFNSTNTRLLVTSI